MKPVALLAFFTSVPGGAELLVIFAVVLLVYGPRRLPGLARKIGKLLTELRRASEEFRDQIMSLDKTDDSGSEAEPPEKHLVPGDHGQADACREISQADTSCGKSDGEGEMNGSRTTKSGQRLAG